MKPQLLTRSWFAAIGAPRENATTPKSVLKWKNILLLRKNKIFFVKIFFLNCFWIITKKVSKNYKKLFRKMFFWANFFSFLVLFAEKRLRRKGRLFLVPNLGVVAALSFSKPSLVPAFSRLLKARLKERRIPLISLQFHNLMTLSSLLFAFSKRDHEHRQTHIGVRSL